MAAAIQGLQTGSDFSPRLLYFISRSNGTLVPLIPADEMPFNIRLLGVPRILSPDQIYGLQHVGSVPYSGLTFKLEHDAVLQRPNSQHQGNHARNYSGPDTMQYNSSYTTPTKDSIMVPASSLPVKPQHAIPSRPLSAPVHELATSWRPPPTSTPNLDKTQDMIDAIINTPSGAETAARIGYTPKSTLVPPSGKVPNLDAKVYCTYWVRHGECDYTQQGCLYKHEMPGSLEELKAIGVKGWPDWWKQKNSALKFGTTRPMVVGSTTRIADWLKVRKVDESDDDSEGVSEEESEGSEKENKTVEDVVETNDKVPIRILKKPETTSRPTTVDTPPPAIDRTIPAESPRKRSLTGDLISFAPLSPTISPFIREPSSLSTSSSASKSTTTRSNTVSSRSPPTLRLTNPPPKKVFIPANETPESHIAEVKKREAQAIKRSANANEVKAAPSLQKQIQELQQEKGKNNGGLMASKHAAPPVEKLVGVDAPQQKMGVRKRVPKPVSTAASGIVQGKVMKGTSEEECPQNVLLDV